MDKHSLPSPAPAVQTPGRDEPMRLHPWAAAEHAGMIVLHVKRPPGGGAPAVEIPVYVLASLVVSVAPSVMLNGTLGGAVVELDGGSRRCVVESAEAVVSLLARMREVHRE